MVIHGVPSLVGQHTWGVYGLGWEPRRKAFHGFVIRRTGRMLVLISVLRLCATSESGVLEVKSLRSSVAWITLDYQSLGCLSRHRHRYIYLIKEHLRILLGN